MSFGIIRPIRPPRDLVNREREYPRVDVRASGVSATFIAQETTDGDGLAAFSFTPPRGNVLTLYLVVPTQTSGTLVCESLGGAPGTPAGAFLCITVPGGTSSLNVYSFDSSGDPDGGRVVGLFGFAA